MSRKVQPVGDRIVIKPIEQADKTSAGIYLPDTAKEKSQEGKVEAVGPGRTNDDGKVIPLTVKAGQHVLYSKYAGTEFTIEGDSLVIISEKDVLAVIDPSPVAVGV